MLRRFLKAKIRDIQLTGTFLEYEGSITLDPVYLEEAGIHDNEEVQVLNFENGSRITTYAIEGKRGSGQAELNGPAAKCGSIGDRIMVLSYCLLHPDEIDEHKPVIVYANKDSAQNAV